MDPGRPGADQGSHPRQDEGEEVHVPDAASRRSTSPRPERAGDERGHPPRRRPRRPLRPDRGRAERVVARRAGRDRRPARRERRGQVEPAQRGGGPRAGRRRAGDVQGRADSNKLTPEAIVRRGIALTPEGRRVFPRLTVADNLRLGAAPSARSRRRTTPPTSTCSSLFPILGERHGPERPARSRAASSRCSPSAGR